MKDEILSYIRNLKQYFKDKTIRMAGFVPHKPYVESIGADVVELDKLDSSVDLLDESKPDSFSPSLMLLLMDKLVPIIRSWKNRFKDIEAKQLNNTEPHFKAKKECINYGERFFKLIVELNGPEHNPLVKFEKSEFHDAVAIIRAFEKNRETYLQSHEIQGAQPPTVGFIASILKYIY